MSEDKSTVGFFDILGYSSFLENNEPEVAAKIIFGILHTARDRARKWQKDYFGEPHERVSKMWDTIQWSVISDSIVISMDINQFNGIKRQFCYFSFLSISIYLYRDLLAKGLAIRGAISYGKFINQNNCFAGRPIINAYKDSCNLELACIAIETEVWNQISELKEGAEKIFRDIMCNKFLCEYLTPCKSGYTKRKLLTPSLPEMEKLEIPDLKQFLASSFWAHKKDLSPEAIVKLDNTERYIRFWLAKSPKIFEGSYSPLSDEKTNKNAFNA